MIRFASLCFAFIFLVSSCTYDHGTVSPCGDLPAEVSFKSDIVPIFEKNCSTVGCHTGDFPTGNLNLSRDVAYQNLMKQGTGYIDTVTPKYSLLYAQMTSTSDPMPPTGRLDECTTNLVLKWIEQNAKNN